MVYSFPANEQLWATYAELRSEGFKDGDSGKAATKFYRQHRKEMDFGAEVAWPERFNYDELLPMWWSSLRTGFGTGRKLAEVASLSAPKDLLKLAEVCFWEGHRCA